MARSIATLFGRPIQYVPGPTLNPIIGQVYIDPTTLQQMAWSGRSWVAIDPGTFMSQEDESAREAALEEELCNKHPGLQELKEQLEEAREKFEAFKALVKE